MPDKRKNNGGARKGSGPKPINPEEKKVTVIFYIKKKYVEKFKAYAKLFLP
jgi:hypothetical protein